MSQNKIRVLFFNYEFPPIGGGASTTNLNLFNEFSRIEDLVIDCVTSTEQDSDYIEKFSERITLYRLSVGKKNLHFWTQLEVLRYLFKSRKLTQQLLDRNHYDLCHGFAAFPSGLIPYRLRKRVPYLVSLLGSDVPGFNPRLRLQYILLSPLFSRIWREAEAVIANSVGLADLGKRFTPDLDIQVITGGVDPAIYFPSLNGSRMREGGVILCVSRLVERKGVHFLIDAFARIAEEIPDVRLVIAGNGEWEGRLREQALRSKLGDRIEFIGYVSRDELPELYRSADVLALPSYYEGMSNAMLEAMASGLPLVISGEGGREELCHGNVLYAGYGRVDQLADSLRKLMCNQVLRRDMGENSRKVSLLYSWGAIAGKYAGLYRTILGK